MNLKSVLVFCALALVGANAADRYESAEQCYQKKGKFIDSRGIPDDDRFACILPYNEGDGNTKFCGTYYGFKGCYAKNLGNMNYCDKQSSEFHSRGCALGLGALYDHVYLDDLNHQDSRDYCYKQNGSMFLEGTMSSPTDTRYACLLPYKNGDEKNKYCVVYGGQHVCYAPNYGNVVICDLKSKYFNSRGCALGLGYLYDGMVNEDKKHNSSRTTCKRKGGLFLENPQERWDRRFACILPEQGTSTKFCGGFNGFNGCYAKQYSNMNVCDKSSPEFNSRGCSLGVGYLEHYM